MLLYSIDICESWNTRRGGHTPRNFSFTGSAWERTAHEALPRFGMLGDSAGGACRAVRSQAEPGNEVVK